MRYRKRGCSPREQWPPLEERDGSQSAPVFSAAAPMTDHDAGAFLLQQIKKTLERLLSQKFQFLELMRERPMRSPAGVPEQPFTGVALVGEERETAKEGKMGRKVVPSTRSTPLSLSLPFLRKRGIGEKG